MRSANQLEIVSVAELLSRSGSEKVTGTSGANGPAINIVVIRVWPHHIGEYTIGGNLANPTDGIKLRHIFKLRAETAVNIEYFIINDCGDWKVIK